MKKLLFVIGYQVDFVSGVLGFPGAEALDEGIARKIRAYGEGPEAKIIIDGSLTASFDPSLHDAPLKALKGIQVEIR